MKKESGLVALICGIGMGSAAALADDTTTSTQSQGSSTVRRTIIQSSSSDSASGGPSNSAKSGSSATSEVVEQSGVMGFQKSNKFVPKYKERLETYHHQIELGLTRGWLQDADADKFKKELERLTALEKSVSDKGYQKTDVDDLDKQFTKFNKDFTDAGQAKPKPAATTPAATSGATGTTAPKPAAPPATSKVTKPAVKPAAKPAAKSSAPAKATTPAKKP